MDLQVFDMTVEDRQNFHALLTNFEDSISTLSDSDTLEIAGLQSMFPKYKFVMEVRQWLDIWYHNIGTPMGEEDE